MEYLFTIQDIFEIEGRGLVLGSNPDAKTIKPGNQIKLVFSDLREIQITIKGVIFETRDILIEKRPQNEQIPIGTQVWLCD